MKNNRKLINLAIMRKAALTLMSLCIFTFTAVSQEVEKPYHPFLKEGKVWEGIYYYYENSEYCESDYTAIAQGDTLINNVVYKKIYEKNVNMYGDDEFHFVSAMIEDLDKKIVYRYNEEINKNIMCAYFTDKNEGDTIMFSNSTWGYIIGDKSLAYYNGELFYYYSFGPTDFETGASWMVNYDFIEGMGGFYETNPFKRLGNNAHIIIYRVYEDDKCLIDLNETYWYELSIQNLTNANSERSNSHSGIFDLQGRRLNSKPSKGIYIENGKKKVSSN